MKTLRPRNRFEEAEYMLRLEYQDGDQGSWIILNERSEVLASYVDRASALAEFQRASGTTGWRQLARVQSHHPWKDGFRAGYARALADSGDNWLQARVSCFPLVSAGAEDVDPYRFRYWAISLLDGPPVREDRAQLPGIDARLTFFDEGFTGKRKQVLIVVEREPEPSHLERLAAAVEQQHAEIGALITLREPEAALRRLAQAAGEYVSPWSGGRYPRLQLLTAAQLVDGQTIAYPHVRDKLTVTTTMAGSQVAPSATAHREQQLAMSHLAREGLDSNRPQQTAH